MEAAQPLVDAVGLWLQPDEKTGVRSEEMRIRRAQKSENINENSLLNRIIGAVEKSQTPVSRGFSRFQLICLINGLSDPLFH
jgi:hypothetical protein